MQSTYQIGLQRITSLDPNLSDALDTARQSKHTPLCVCQAQGVAMYIAKIGERFYVKRMPNSGSTHAPVCESYEPPAEVSGLSQVLGSAIRENPEDGTVALALDFSLRKMPGRAPPVSSEAHADTAKSNGTKLSLRAMLHYLWDDAGFTRWSPAMAKKRNWFVVRKYLLQAAENKRAKGAGLASHLYIPESFDLDDKDAIEQRRIAQLSGVATNASARALKLVIAEVKSFSPSRHGFKLQCKHLPDFPFMMNEELHARVNKLFGAELELWESFADTHLMAIATASVSTTGVASIEEIALMLVNTHWLPFENTFERTLLQLMVDQQRYFHKSLRYNLPLAKPVACLVATDTPDKPTAMYLVLPNVNQAYLQELDEITQASSMHSWIWKPGDEAIPSLPSSRKSETRHSLMVSRAASIETGLSVVESH